MLKEISDAEQRGPIQVEDWELKEVEIYCQFINGMDHGSRELFVETIVPAICLALKKQPIGLGWNDVVEALNAS